MDYSDEQQSFDHSKCNYEPDPLNCDEHICSAGDWSCGDGQCINEKNRYEWQESTANTIPKSQCHSMREYMFMCELSEQFKLWTSINGTCYDSSTIRFINESWNEFNQTSNQYCLYLVKCALSDGLERKCPCKKMNCGSLIKKHCLSTIEYPEGRLLTPYLTAHYSSDRQWSGRKQPNFYTMSGSIRCRGYHARININKSVLVTNIADRRNIQLEDLFCTHPFTLKDIDGVQYHSSCYANISHTLGRNLSYGFFDVCQQCISQYRINDGIQDCVNNEDEKPQQTTTCSDRVRHHRYQCSGTTDTCLMIKFLGDSLVHCNQSDDEIDFQSGQSLSTVKCNAFEDDECGFLRDYILKSKNMNDNSADLIANTKIPFRSYCNTFWNLKDKSDESLETCQSWICAQNEYQCRTNQCVPKSYVCDGEWDCDDASDEIFDINKLSDHNRMINLTINQTICDTMRNNTVEPFGSFCNLTREYPCLLINFTDQSDPIHIRPCIKINQIGNHYIDCLGGIDEKNTLSHFNEIYQLGYAFQCRSTSNMKIDDDRLCANTSRCQNQNDDFPLCGDRHKNCSHIGDFLCMNGSCIKDARCNRKMECKYGEDEYGCNPRISQTVSKYYRVSKRQKQNIAYKDFRLPRFPPKIVKTKTIVEQEEHIIVKRDIPLSLDASAISLMCNRGVVAVHYTNNIICFCPPSYYGEYCEYHNDRLTSYVHLNVSYSDYSQPTTNINIALRIIILLIYENQIIHSQQFIYRPVGDIFRIVKKKFFLIYSREKKLLEKKLRRNWNRSLIVNDFPYSLQYEAYELKMNSEIKFVGVWRYSLYFDFLPSFRFAKTLRFLQKQPNSFYSPCYSNPCKSTNAECHILQNDEKKYICLCKSGYSGENCSIKDEYCQNDFCHSNALCKPTYLGIIAGNRFPLCICPLDRYGRRCGLIYNQCQNNPCQNNGSCYPSTSNISKSNCICSNDYHGDQCQLKKDAFDHVIHANKVSELSVVQYFYIDYNTLNLVIERQNMYEQPFHHLHHQYTKKYGPHVVLLKNYPNGSVKYPNIFLLSLIMNEKNINSSTNLTDDNLCLEIKQIFQNMRGKFLIFI